MSPPQQVSPERGASQSARSAGSPSSNRSKLPGSFSSSINPRNYNVEQKYRLHGLEHVIVTRSKTNADESIALRLRVGRGGYSQWLNELYVYLLPNFQHQNVLPFLGCDKTSLLRVSDDTFNSICLLDESENELYQTSTSITEESEQQLSAEEARKRRRDKLRTARIKHPTVDYWILNDYSGCITLRHYLMMHTITWAQLVKIARGIMGGLNYLHENAEYQHDDASSKLVVDNFIRSTGGALKRVSFRSLGSCIYMTPPLFITIIHRNLSSLNIVLRKDFTPCIWNFGYAYVYHPFQPINYDHLVDKPIKTIHMSSPYSPPEVLCEKGLFTLNAMKSIDMYATGVILWELMSRCVLPKLDGATPEEEHERTDPDQYQEPFAREFRCSNAAIKPHMLKHAVARLRTRPCMRPSWLIGKKTARMVQTIRELWDQDAEARLQTSTVIERLDRLSLRDRDRRYKYQAVLERQFDLDRMWPPVPECTMAPIITNKCDSTMYVEDLCKVTTPRKFVPAPARDNISTSESTASLISA